MILKYIGRKNNAKINVHNFLNMKTRHQLAHYANLYSMQFGLSNLYMPIRLTRFEKLKYNNPNSPPGIKQVLGATEIEQYFPYPVISTRDLYK